MMSARILAPFLLAVACVGGAHAQATGTTPASADSRTVTAQAADAEVAPRRLEHDAYEIWNRVADPILSDDGQWAVYATVNERDGSLLHAHALAGAALHRIERGADARITEDARFVVFLIKPTQAALEEARIRKTKPERMPQDSLGFLDLATGAVTRVARVQSFKLPEEAAGHVAYLHGRAPEEQDTVQADSAAAMPEPNPVTGNVPPVAAAGEPPAAADSTEQPDHEKDEGSTLVLRALADGGERRFEDVVWYDFTKDGTRLIYTASNEDGSADGVFVVDLAAGTATPLMAGVGHYRQVAIAEAGDQVAFLSNRDDFASEQPAFTLYHARLGGDARALAATGDRAFPGGWWVSEHGTVRFSHDGRRVFFGTAPRPPLEADEDEVDPDDVVRVDVWNWRDPYLQPMQLRRLEDEQKRTYDAVVHLRNGTVVQLADEAMPELELGDRGDADVALGSTDVPYRHLISWDGRYADYFLVDVQTGERTRVLEAHGGRASLSPDGRFAAWFDGDAQQWFAVDTRSGRTRMISEGVPHPLHDEEHDTPNLPGPYGSAGWTTDGRLLVYDRFDIWALDPSGDDAPRMITEGEGRRSGLRFRYLRVDREERAIEPARDILLSAFNVRDKSDGFYRDRVRGEARPVRLIMEAKSFGTPQQAEDAATLLFTRADFTEYPDLWVSGPDFSDMRRISDANPQQAEYAWGTAELVEWRSADGTPLQGVLYKPDGFDASKKYPMMVYFYERLSDNLHRHVAPAAGGSSINTSFYVSRGYLVFTPDIPYRIGYPGESAMNAVVPGVLSLLERGFIDDRRIGVQGHSWGGYQIAYMLTKTNLFAAAEAGAPVANMISAYGGIRWGTGMSRMFQYEKTQSRIGGSLWEAPLHFIENSPIFWADKVETPLLMMHNDQDGAVPWEQGIEYFVALRRLGKPVFMLNYNGEDHGLRREANRKDWAVRMQQFFDHYLLDAPPPVWMAEGVPAIVKGETRGLELVEQGRKAESETDRRKN